MAKMELCAMGEKALEEWWVLKQAKMAKTRLNTLTRWEVQRYGAQRITDLNRSGCGRSSVCRTPVRSSHAPLARRMARPRGTRLLR